MASRERLFLLDGMAIAYRSYFAFIQRPLINSRGENTSAIYGFVTFLNKILQQERPDYIAVVFDTSKPTFRHQTYKEYKATRQKMPDDMIPQIDLLKEVVGAYNIPVIELDGYEADDIMGTLARRAEEEMIATYLVTSDKDFMQLVSDGTKIYKPGRSGNEVEIVDTERVREKFGVGPDRVIDVLGLIGDSSDNVPGVPGIGEKTAIPLVQKFGSIEDIYKNIDSVEPKGVRAKLEGGREKAFLSKRLVTIDVEVPLEIDIRSLRGEGKDVSKLVQLFERLEFRSLLQNLKTAEKGESPPGESVPEKLAAEESSLIDIGADRHEYRLVKTERELQSLCSRLQEAGKLVFDTETTSTDPLRAELVGISFCVQPREAFFVPVNPPPAQEGSDPFSSRSNGRPSEGLPLDLVVKLLKPVLESPDVAKIGHNVKYDLLVLSQHGIWTEGVEFDTMIASYILRADGKHSLDAVAREHLGYRMVSYTDLTGTGKEQRHIRDVPLERLCDYSCEDSDITFRLYEVLNEKLRKEVMIELCERVEFPLIPVLARMERLGVAIDVGVLHDMSKELERELDNLTRDIHRLAGGPFNINSTQQLGEVLFNKLKLRKIRKTKTGYSTDVGVLEELRGDHPIVERLLEYRQLAKLKSTYVDALPALINPQTGRVHTSFNQTIAATGRLSSSEPNLQNIPIRTEIGRSIRKAFIPGREGFAIMSADYSQIELRVMAHVSGDEGLVEAFRNREDIHATTAAKVFGVSPNEVTREMRRRAKEVNFGIMYGIGPFGLASRLEISQPEAREIIDRYFKRFPKVKEYINATIERARTDGYVQTILGRRRYLTDINSRNQNVRQNAERQAINMPIQGTAADMIKLAMVNIDRELLAQGLETRMLLQVHDELVFEVRRSEEELVRSLVTRLMQEALPLSVPLEVEIGVGGNWLEAH